MRTVTKGVEAIMRAAPSIMLVAFLVSFGCSASKDQSETSSPKTEPAAAPEAAARTDPFSSIEPSGAAPHYLVQEEPIASGAPSAPMTSTASSESRNPDFGSSSLLHPQQVQSQSKAKAAASKSIRGIADPVIAMETKTPAPYEFSPAAPSTTENAKENLPAVSLHECELFHNHRTNKANELTVLYGTDRDRVDKTPVLAKLWAGFCSSLTGSIVVTTGFGAGAFFAARKKALILATIASGLFSIFLGYPMVADISVSRLLCSERKPGYGVGRGDLQLGVCRVSVPPIHTKGEMETTSFLSLDVIPDPERHFLLNEIEPLSDEPFYAELRRQVAQSSKKDVFIFVHGYNVTFESAALRTAQMKSDLEFEGAACFYSWPSQGGLLQYTRDEENVRYTLSHLRQFLASITQQSGAESIHLIAHSMGNRAVTDVLKELRLELGKDKSKLFNQVILAAPDVDAQVFMNELAPRIRDTAERVTLYASSNDRALIASKIVHGYPRAGESGKGLVVVDGVETVDVSNVDCSLLGHSYYGDSTSVLTDLSLVLRGKKPALERSWLLPEQAQGVTFWRFSAQQFETARRLAQQIR
jgi:esterase/lipase superfamily enzyme